MRDSTSTLAIPKCRFSEPRHNLPSQHKGVTTPESRYTIAFARAYQQQHLKIHSRSEKTQLAIVREIAVNGFGITDMLAVAWDELAGESFPTAEVFAEVARPTCRAFELKLSHWQKALYQAFRYRSFSHQAIVVVPQHVCNNAIKMLTTFRTLHVGLWSFDKERLLIKPVFTPRPQRPFSNIYWYKALSKAAKANSVLPIHEKS